MAKWIEGYNEFFKKTTLDSEIKSFNSRIRGKKILFSLQFFTMSIWLLCSVSNFMNNNMFSFYSNVFCVACWGFLSFLSFRNIKELNGEKHEKFDKLIEDEKKKENLQSELKTLNFFGKK